MEPMEIDEVTIVPDSPDESAKQNIVRLGGLRFQNVSNKHSRNWTTSSNIANSRKINPPRGIIRPGRSGNHASPLPMHCGDSSTYRGFLVRKQGTNYDVSHENKNSDNECPITNKKPFITSQSSSSPGRPVVDLRGCSKEPVKLFQSNLGVTQAGEFKEGSASEDDQSSRSRENGSHMLHNGGGKRMVNNVVTLDLSPDIVDPHGGHFYPGPALPKSDCINSPKPSRQKRLVRNGCISPMNIAKGKQPVEKNNSGSRDREESDYCTTADTSLGDHIPMQNSGDYSSRSLKGKEVLVKNSDVSRNSFETRRSAGSNEKANVYNANRGTFSSLSGSNGWRTTRNQSSGHNFLSPLSYEVQHIPIEDVGQASGNKALRRDNNDDGSIVHLGTNDLISNTCPSRQTSSQPSAQCSRIDRRSHKAHTAFAKRQKPGPTLSTHAECSRSAADDSEIIEISSSSKDSRPQFFDNMVDNGVGNGGSVIYIDEVTPDRQHNTSHSTGRSFSNEDAVATQVELDERLAQELQRQFYDEDFTGGTNETDAHIALSLQQEEASHTVSRGRRPLSNPRGSSSGQFSSRDPLNLGRRGAHARAPAPSRITRMRNRFTGTPHTLSSSRGRNSNIRPTRQRNSVFSPDIDVETRMLILEAWENDMAARNSFLQIQRDFNENDYESLLALDDNNHEHAGATARQINGLPESTVQTESLEEACSICLENPAMGDVIRHLPCLHKFHKDCIDPWLRRRTSCPVCKSSIT